MTKRTEKRKITVQVLEPLLKTLNRLTTDACLNRDAYLDHVLAHEATMLDEESEGRRNSDFARAYVKRRFLNLKNLRPVSFNLSIETAGGINSVCEEVNVWRDVFVNRVLFLLMVDDDALEKEWDIVFRDYTEAIFNDGWEFQGLLLGPRLQAIHQFIRDDPFFALRTALREAYPETKGHLHFQQLGQPLVSTSEKPGLVGLNVYLPDEAIPGTRENDEIRKVADEVLASFLDKATGHKGELS